MALCNRRQALIVLGGLALARPVLADDYPRRPIRIIVGFPPGGSSDNTVRLVADALHKQLGESVVVENRPGASGSIAAKAVAAMPPDGYNLFYATSSSHAIAPHLNAKLGYDPLVDFAPITALGRGGLVLTASTQAPVSTLEEFFTFARANPGAVYASPGHASSQHLAMVLLAQENGLQLTHAPYRGSAPGLTDLIGGHVPFMIDNVLAPLPHIRSGKIKAIAVTGIERSHLLPDVPTIDESGLQGFDVQAWGGIVAPAGTPDAIVQLLNGEITKALQIPSIRQAILDGGSTPQGGSAGDFARFIAKESGKWKGVVERNGIKAEA
jgi:tripartite-type tricarboxylate transporter receptor subunit TctC